ncbi:MAG: outer membrane lipoprotein carrier protein LolA [Candidatus Cloacimonetes bacterium]|nr:outer membrane lipoprotein carrier protein LolA [Candidatus Cloacimonadota bacterium]
MRNLLILLALLLTVAAHGQSDEAMMLKETVLQTYGSLVSFQASFVQTNNWPELEKSLVSEGMLSYNRERVLLRYSEPSGHILLALPSSIHMWDPNANREIILAPDELAGRLRPVDIVEYYAEGAQLSVEREEGLRVLRIVPTEEKDLLQLRVFWNDALSRIDALSYEDAEGNQVEYRFSRQEFNPQLADSVFDIALPQDRDILDTRQ